MQAATRHGLTDRATTEGFVTIPVRLQGHELDSITVTVDLDLDEDDGPGWIIQSDDDTQYASDEEDTRAAVACMAREIRQAEVDRRADEDADNAEGFVSGLIERGKAGDVLRALKAAGLI